MRKWLLYLVIFCLFFGLMSYGLILTISPVDDSGAANWWGRLALVGLMSGLVFCLTSLVLSSVASLKATHKLPSLLVKETFFYSWMMAAIIGGWLLMRLIGGGNLWQAGLWCIILVSVAWTVRARATDHIDR